MSKMYDEACDAFERLVLPVVNDVQADYWVKTGDQLTSDRALAYAFAYLLRSFGDNSASENNLQPKKGEANEG